MNKLSSLIVPTEISSFLANETLYKDLYTKALIIIGMPITVFLTIYHLIYSRYIAAGLIFVMFLSLCFLLFTLIKKSAIRMPDLIREISIRVFLIFFVFSQMYDVWIAQTLSSIPWFLLFPLLIFFSTNIKEALIWSSCIAVILFYSLFLIDLDSNPDEIFHLKSRLIIIFGILAIIALIISGIIRSAMQILFDNAKETQAVNLRLKKEIKEHGQAVETLRKNEEVFRLVSENADDVIWTIDMDLNYTYISPAIEKIQGWSPKEATSLKINDVLTPSSLEIAHKRIEANLVSGSKTGNYDMSERLELEMFCKDGATIWTEISASFILGEDGKPLGILGVTRDITERKNLEDKLKESEEKYRHLFKNAPAGIFEIDFEKQRFVNVNDIMCDYSGYSEKDFLSMNPLDLLTEKSKQLFITRFEKISMDKTKSNTAEYSIVKKNGDQLNILLNNDYIYDSEGLIGAQVVVHDITEFKQAEAEKIKAQKIAGEQKKLALVGQVAGKMAHDFNNILGVIMGNAELSIMDCKDTETKETLKLILGQTQRGKNLTKNLVAFAKDQEPKQEFFRINKKIDLVLNLIKKDLEGIDLLKDEGSNVPDLLADPGMIEHALVNLLQNSIHALSLAEHPQIIVRTYCVDMNICIEIEDNGCGIPDTYLKEIYEPSFTLKGSKDLTSSYKTGIKGTGYGMANVRKYIEQHKGTIEVNSEFGSGTKITIGLPVMKRELTSDEKTKIQKEMTQFEKYILLVEDEIAISDVQYKILTQDPCNHKVDTANNGQAAMDLFDRNKYDFVSLDYILPGGINGMDVYSYIRETNKAIPILFISGNIEFLESIKVLKQKDKYIDHLSKPCMNIDYLNCINKLLEKLTS